LLPELQGHNQWLQVMIAPPGHFITGLMQLAMMATAERHSELITDFETEGPGLGKA
jgi:hypothetical protein